MGQSTTGSAATTSLSERGNARSAQTTQCATEPRTAKATLASHFSCQLAVQNSSVQPVQGLDIASMVSVWPSKNLRAGGGHWAGWTMRFGRLDSKRPWFAAGQKCGYPLPHTQWWAIGPFRSRNFGLRCSSARRDTAKAVAPILTARRFATAHTLARCAFNALKGITNFLESAENAQAWS